MSNSSIIERINSLLDSYEPSTASTHELQDAIDFHVAALEKIDLDIIHQARNFAFEISEAHCIAGGEEFGSSADATRLIQNFRTFLRSLPQ